MTTRERINAAKHRMQRVPCSYVSLQCAVPPSVNELTKNIPGKGRANTKVYDDWIKSAGWEIAIQNPGCVSGPYHLLLTIRRASLRRDLDGYIKPLSDLLVKMGVIDDDRYCISLSAQWTDAWDGVRMTVLAHGHKAEEQAA
jgi:Holliday junction resolvase RusA-like endonuclease